MRTRSALVMFGALSLALGACSSGPSAAAPGKPLPSASSTTDPAVLTADGDRVVNSNGTAFTVQLEGAATVVKRVGDAKASRLNVRGRWTLPRVVPDGPASGLTPDGQTLALVGGAKGGSSRIALLHTSLAEAPRIVTLKGDFSFDAWNRDGSVLYLIEHRPPLGSGHYVVRAYDVRERSLRADVVVDKRNIGEEMAGRPVARATISDGAVVATLYVPTRSSAAVGAGDWEHDPFVHLLFTDQAQALCVDLPPAADPAWSMEYDGGRLLISNAGTAYTLDPETGTLSTA